MISNFEKGCLVVPSDVPNNLFSAFDYKFPVFPLWHIGYWVTNNMMYPSPSLHLLAKLDTTYFELTNYVLQEFHRRTCKAQPFTRNENGAPIWYGLSETRPINGAASSVSSVKIWISENDHGDTVKEGS